MCVEDAYNRIGRLCKVPHIHRHLPLQKLVETLDEPRIFSSSNLAFVIFNSSALSLVQIVGKERDGII